MDKEKLDKIIADHELWLDNEGGCRANLCDANLYDANLRDANLCDANLCDANLDFSCWPLWCGSIGVKIDSKISRQLVYHALCNLPEEDRKEFIDNPFAYANKFHRVGEVNKLKEE